jgi:hypothetical protein
LRRTYGTGEIVITVFGSFRILVEPGFTECVLANGELEQRGRTATRGWVVRGSSPWTWASAHRPAEERESTRHGLVRFVY